MKELFMKTENGNVPIKQNQIEKYNLEKGRIAPFSGHHIVDKNGDDTIKSNKRKNPENHTIDELMADTTLFQTSEILDISSGVDSDI